MQIASASPTGMGLSSGELAGHTFRLMPSSTRKAVVTLPLCGRSTMGCSKWCDMWTQHFVNISLRCQVANNLHKWCFPGKVYTTPHHDTPTTIGCNWLTTALCMLLSNSTPHPSPAINVTQATSRLISEHYNATFVTF